MTDEPGPPPSSFHSQFLPPPPHLSPSPIRLIPAPNFLYSFERLFPPPTSILTKELVTKNFVLVQRVRKKGVGEGPSWVGDPGPGQGQGSLTCVDGILLVEVQVRMDVGVLVVMGGHVEHLQPRQWVIAQGGHPFCMLPLSCQTLRLALLLALAFLLALPLALALLFFARALFGLAPHLLYQVGPFLGQLGPLQRYEVQIAARARVKAAVQAVETPFSSARAAGYRNFSASP
ncbi:TPA: hypothetical protein BOS_6004 [Bos taurus]|nr:TPA: hypothetical protein BOS_6004 [Bos taurus]